MQGIPSQTISRAPEQGEQTQVGAVQPHSEKELVLPPRDPSQGQREPGWVSLLQKQL